MPRIIGYTYEADAHCPACAAERFGVRDVHRLKSDPSLDEHGIPESAKDSDGNRVHPIFVGDALAVEDRCGDCSLPLD